MSQGLGQLLELSEGDEAGLALGRTEVIDDLIDILAMMVKLGFTAAIDTKKLASTT